jgi:predicted nuclease of restriction endonuclease-like RecB superfamily
MLTGKLVRVRFGRDRITPWYLDTADPSLLEMAERLLEIFRSQAGRTRGELENEIEDVFGDDPTQLVLQGLAKLLEDRCEFEIVSSRPPEEIREVVFQAAAAARRAAQCRSGAFPREEVLRTVGAALGLDPEQVQEGLFADLKSEQRLIRFPDVSSQHLLERYNVSLAQAMLLRSTRVHVTLRHEPATRYRSLFRWLKFHRLICEVERKEPDCCVLHLDGPLSLFSATQKYGLQLALFLPAVLLCRDFELTAELRWGPQRKPKTFQLSARDGLVSHLPDSGSHVPAEMAMFVELFRKRIDAWEIAEETQVLPMGAGFWVPDFRLRHISTGKTVLLEVLGFWRRSSAMQHLARLREHVKQPFLLAVSDQLRIDDKELEELPAGIHRFRQMPLPDEIARLAEELVG